MQEAYRITELGQEGFGIRLEFKSGDLEDVLAAFAANVDVILDRFYAARGLLVIEGMHGVFARPRALVEVSRLFGSEVENYHQTLTSPRFFHDSEEEILILSNEPPCNHRPPPKASHNEEFKVEFPHQVNWHSDQSYRRPPPDITLLLAVRTPPPDQGQTLVADCTSACVALNLETRERLRHLNGIHAPSWVGRSREAVEQGEPVLDLLPHQVPQQHPLLRRHPVSGEESLFVCEEKQMDFVDGPVAELEAGPDGEGARLIRKLLAHVTQERFVYTHRWQVGDLLITDNRNLLHCATWYDSDSYSRLMWRTTVMGNPGDEYEGEEKSWIPQDGSQIMAGMDHA